MSEPMLDKLGLVVITPTLKKWSYNWELMGEVWVRNGMRDYVPVEINKQWPIRRGDANA